MLGSVRMAFVHGVDLALLVSAGIAVVGCVLTLIFLPQTNSVRSPHSVEEVPDVSVVQ
jgi:hypothetical protein